VEFDEAPVCEGDVFGVRGSVVAVLPIPEGVCRVTAAALIKQTRSKQHVSAITHDIRSSWRILVVGLASQHSSKPVYVYADVILDIPALYGSRLYRNCLDLFRDSVIVADPAAPEHGFDATWSVGEYFQVRLPFNYRTSQCIRIAT
jgi:hypothetical protein